MHTPRTIAAGVCLATALFAASAAHAGVYRAPRTHDGQPDLQGIWTNVSVTRLERKPGLPLIVPRTKEAAFEKAAIWAFMHITDDPFDQRASEWQPEYRAARIAGRMRTSFVVSPADGRLPWRPEARKAYEALQAAIPTSADGPEARPLSDRCLVVQTGPPMGNPNSAGGRQIVQTPTEIAIVSEMIHDVRIVRLGSRGGPRRPPHLPGNVRPWMGDSIGWWEGDTLVVETTNLHPQERLHAGFIISPDARITERFTRVSATELIYAYEVDDPATFTEVWRAEMPFHAESGPLYEFACHEGNYSMAGTLAGARREEADAKAAGQRAH